MVNSNFHDHFKEAAARYPNNNDRLWTRSIVEEDQEKCIHMVHLATVVKYIYR
jgi:hypothetical protein